MPFFLEWNQSCQPPWEAWDLERKLHEADKSVDERGHLTAIGMHYTGSSESATDPLGGQVEIEFDADKFSRGLNHTNDSNRLAAPERIEASSRARVYATESLKDLSKDSQHADEWDAAASGAVKVIVEDFALCLADAVELLRSLRKEGLIPPWTDQEIDAKVKAGIAGRGEALRSKVADLFEVKKSNQPHRSQPKRQPGVVDYLSFRTPEGQTDLALAKRLIAKYGSRLRYCFAWHKFLVWDGRRWKVDDSGEPSRMMKEVGRDLWLEAAASIDGQPLSSDDAKALTRLATRSQSRKGIDDALKLVTSEPGIAIVPGDLDQDPWLLNCPNGTLDLRTGKLRDHDTLDNITKLCPTLLDPNAKCSEWETFLSQIVAPEIAVFLQRYAGYSLTGDVREQVLPIWYGTGSNGKSTFFTAFTEMLGTDYAIKCDKSLIVAQKHTGHSTERMDLFGKRFVIASETEEGEKLAEAQIKDLTGGEVIRGRRMREDTWEYFPTHKLIMATNHKPEISGTDEGIWRRVILIESLARFWDPDKGESGPDHLRVNKKLREVFAANHAAILAWAVRGCLDWQRDGLAIPTAIRAATDSYRNDQDAMGGFLADRCETSSLTQIREKASSIYEAYLSWCRASAREPLSMKKFGLRMKEKFESKNSDGVWYLGVCLKDVPAEDTEGLEPSPAPEVQKLCDSGF